MMEICGIGLTIDIRIAKNAILQPILLSIIPDIPFTSHLANIAGPWWMKRHVFCYWKVFAIYFSIDGVAVGSKDELFHSCVDAALQSVEQATNMNVCIC
jgi:hypothetical protein